MPAAAATPRIAPLEPPYDPAVEESLRKMMGPARDVEPLRLFRTYYRHFDLASRLRPLGGGLLAHGLVEPRHREIVILRTTALAGAEYEWGVHAAIFGPGVGLGSDDAAAIASGALDGKGWSEEDRLLVRLADELHASATVSDALWAELAGRFSDEQLIELLVLAGWYRLHSYVINAARIVAEEWAPRFPAATLAARGDL